MLNIYNPNQQPDEQNANPKDEKETAQKKADFRRYVDTSGDIGNKELAYSMWWVRHKVLFYRIGLFALLILNFFLYSFNVGLWGSYLLGITDDRRLELYSSRFYNYNNYQAHFSPIQLDITSTEIFKSASNRYDAVAVVNNPNTKFTADVEYRFILNSTSTELMTTKILASQTGILAALGLPEELVGTGEITLRIEKVKWQRIDNHQISDAISWQSERLNFVVSEPIFQTAFSNNDGLSANRVAFKLKNNSAYSYKTPRFIIALYSGQVLVGVMTTQTSNFIAGEEKFIDLRNFAPNLQVSDIKVFPQIDIYDNSNILPPER